MAIVSDRAIREGLSDYADECEDDAAEQARIDAENREIMEDILFAEFDAHLRTLDDQELIDELCSSRSKAIIERTGAELQRRMYEWECELERQDYSDEEDCFGEY